MTRGGSLDRGKGAEHGAPRPRRLTLAARSAAAPVVLALTTVAAVGSAVLALLPAALRRRPVGRLAEGVEDAAPGAEAASEPLVP